jgi:hypothetical protein
MQAFEPISSKLRRVGNLTKKIQKRVAESDKRWIDKANRMHISRLDLTGLIFHAHPSSSIRLAGV